jgi:putative transposase
MAAMSRYRRAHVPGGTFFFTVTLADRSSSLLTTHIGFLRTAYRRAAELYPFETIAICVLPDHLHALWQLPPGDADFSRRWALIKAGFSRQLAAHPARTESKIRHREKGLWQRRFWEHHIRDDADLQRHADYIHLNPLKHGHVAAVKDWPHSSFHQWVKRGWLTEDWAGTGNGEGKFGE